MMIPVMFDIRIKKYMPIVEVRAICNSNVNLWIDEVLQRIDVGEKIGGRLLSDEPKGFMRPNTVYFSIIFQNISDAVEYAQKISNR